MTWPQDSRPASQEEAQLRDHARVIWHEVRAAIGADPASAGLAKTHGSGRAARTDSCTTIGRFKAGSSAACRRDSVIGFGAQGY